MDAIKCPYCFAPCEAASEQCAFCGSGFPWAASIRELRNDVKSREVNRGRATATLIEEGWEAARGGKPISVSAVKGFMFAWLFPRSVIVLGSVAAALMLGIQTWILSEQSQLLAGQTAAARMEQDARLEARIARNKIYADRLSQMVPNTSLLAEIPQECNDDCTVSIGKFMNSWDPSALTLFDNRDSLDNRVRGVFALADSAARTVSSVGANQGKIDDKPGMSEAIELIENSSIQCTADSEGVKQLLVAVRVLGSIQAYLSPRWAGKEFEMNSDPKRFQFRLLANLLRITVGPYGKQSSPDALDDYTYIELVTHMSAIGRMFRDGLETLRKKCESSVAHDMVMLARLRKLS